MTTYFGNVRRRTKQPTAQQKALAAEVVDLDRLHGRTPLPLATLEKRPVKNLNAAINRRLRMGRLYTKCW